MVIDKIMRIFFPDFWLYEIQISKKQEHNNGKEIVAELILHLKQICDLKNIKFFVVPLAHQRYSKDQINKSRICAQPIKG